MLRLSFVPSSEFIYHCRGGRRQNQPPQRHSQYNNLSPTVFIPNMPRGFMITSLELRQLVSFFFFFFHPSRLLPINKSNVDLVCYLYRVSVKKASLLLKSLIMQYLFFFFSELVKFERFSSNFTVTRKRANKSKCVISAFFLI